MTENQNNMTPELKYLQSIDAEVNEHGAYIYTSTNGKSSMNVESILEDFGSQQHAAGVEAGKKEAEQSKWIPVVNTNTIEKYKDLWLSDGRWVLPGYLDRNNDFRAFNSDGTLNGVKYCKPIGRPTPPNHGKETKE